MRNLPTIKKILQDNPLVLVDGGARNGTFELEGLAHLIHSYGFEPNKDEYDKLVSGKTDNYQESKVKQPPYVKVVWSDKALGISNGPSILHLTAGPGACSLLKPNLDVTRQYAPNWAWNFEPGKPPTMKVECVTLEELMSIEKLRQIDYLKLDTQGNEMDILLGANEALSRISVIKTEVEFQEVYRGQFIFRHIDRMLRDKGFHFIDLVSTPEHRIGRHVLPIQPTKGELIWADAIYAKDFTSEDSADSLTILKQALVLIEMGYASTGWHILKNLIGTPLMPQMDEIGKAYAPQKRTLKSFVPTLIKTAARKAFK